MRAKAVATSLAGLRLQKTGQWEAWRSKNPTPERPARTWDLKNQAQRSTSRRKNAPQRPMVSQTARKRSGLTKGSAASAHLGQLPAVRPAIARSPGNRRPRLEGPGRETRAAGSAAEGKKCSAIQMHRSAKPGRSRRCRGAASCTSTSRAVWLRRSVELGSSLLAGRLYHASLRLYHASLLAGRPASRASLYPPLQRPPQQTTSAGAR